MDGLFDDLQEQVTFNLDQILPPETRDSINAFTNAGLQAIDYTTYITQITSQISTLAVDSTISTLETVRDTLSMIEVSMPSSKNYIHNICININFVPTFSLAWLTTLRILLMKSPGSIKLQLLRSLTVL